MSTSQDTTKLSATTTMATDQPAFVASASGYQHSTIDAAMINHPVFAPSAATTSLPTSTTLATTLEQWKRLTAKMILITYLGLRILQNFKKENIGLVNWGYFICKAVMKKLVSLTEKIEILESKKEQAEKKIGELQLAGQKLLQRVRDLTREIGQLIAEKKTLTINSQAAMLAKDVWEAAAHQQEEKVKGLEELASDFKKRLIQKSKDNKTNEELVVSLKEKIELLEEMNESKEKRLKALG